MAPILVPLLLLVAAVAGCASSKPVKLLEEESRHTSIRLAEVQQATEELRKELATLRTQVDTLRHDLEQAVKDADTRQREAADTMGKRVAGSEKRLEALAGAVRGVEMSVGGLSDQVAKLETVSTAS